MDRYEATKINLRDKPRKWLVTGAAGFIGSHIVEQLMALGQNVIGLDNFATGSRSNLEEIRAIAKAKLATESPDNVAPTFKFLEGDIRDLDTCQSACSGVDYVLHQAALGSVPRSLADPISTNQVNVDGFLNMLVSSRDANVKRFVYAASSSTYGDHSALPKVESRIGNPLSPYAITKLVNEHYARVFASAYGFESIGLRYFNVFGPRQDPNGSYAAVIPKWTSAMMESRPVWINGDGETSRDFCYVANAVQANLLAATTTEAAATNEVYNIALGDRTTLNELFNEIRLGLVDHFSSLGDFTPGYRDARPGDVRHSQASIEKAMRLLGYSPSHSFRSGLSESLDWYIANR